MERVLVFMDCTGCGDLGNLKAVGGSRRRAGLYGGDLGILQGRARAIRS